MEIPLRVSRAWSQIRERDERYMDTHDGQRADYVYLVWSRYGMLTSGAAGNKCLACQELFPLKQEAKEHPCEYEAEYRMITGRHVKMTRAQGNDKSDILLLERIEALEERVT